MKLQASFFFIIFLFSISCFASNPILDMANLYEESGLYDQAITEYQRYLFFHPDSSSSINISVSISDNFKKLSRINESRKWLQRAIERSQNSSIKDSLKLKLLPLLIAEKKYALVEMNAIKLIFFSRSEEIVKQAHFYLGLTYLYQNRWQKATDEFAQYSSNMQFHEQLTQLNLHVQELRFKSPAKAKWLSTFLPGLGQLYAEDYKNAINALAINSITIGLITYSFLDKDYLQILLSEALLFERYYTGNRVNAEMTAEKFNLKLNNKTFNSFIELLYSFEKDS